MSIVYVGLDLRSSSFHQVAITVTGSVTVNRSFSTLTRCCIDIPRLPAAATIGVPDALYGEEVAAFIVLKEGATSSDDELIAYCKEHLADSKRPKSIRIVNGIPKGHTGKLLKRELASWFNSSTQGISNPGAAEDNWPIALPKNPREIRLIDSRKHPE